MKKAESRPVQDAEFRPFLKSTGHKRQDRMFNWVLMRHTAAGRKRSWRTLFLVPGEKKDGLPWTKSDEWFWSMGIYKIPDFVGVLVFIYVIYIIGAFTYDHYGAARLAVVLVVMILVRLNRLVSLQAETNKLLAEKK